MHIRSVEITNIRSISHLKWQLPKGHSGSGWHVILGDNGSGKSSFMQAVALALVGSYEAQGLREDWTEWLRRGEERAEILLSVPTPHLKSPRNFKITLESDPKEKKGLLLTGSESAGRGGAWRSGSHGFVTWFSAAFGPFRRFRGGDAQFAKLFDSHPQLARHLSVFDEGVALSEGLQWLKELAVARLMKKNSREARLLKQLQEFVNKNDLLPQKTRLIKVDPRKVEFRDGQGKQVELAELSDGFRATLSMTFELIRQMASMHPRDTLFQEDDEGLIRVTVSGVVLIDEVDAHLHPTWQHRIGDWFKRFFPNIQFIVTTHSPIICQAAAGGSVYKLPTPGTDEEGRMIEGLELGRLVYGDVLDAYSTPAFDATATRSELSEQLIEELGELNVKELSQGLSAAEKQRQRELRTILPGVNPQGLP